MRFQMCFYPYFIVPNGKNYVYLYKDHQDDLFYYLIPRTAIELLCICALKSPCIYIPMYNIVYTTDKYPNQSILTNTKKKINYNKIHLFRT